MAAEGVAREKSTPYGVIMGAERAVRRLMFRLIATVKHGTTSNLPEV
jgi:hypothetical protein